MAMLPSMPLISESSSSDTERKPRMAEVLQKRSPSCNTGLKKPSPLKHITPILRKYSAQRKAVKNVNKLHQFLSQRKTAPVVSESNDEDVATVEIQAEPVDQCVVEPCKESKESSSAEIGHRPGKRSRHAKEMEATISCLSSCRADKDDYVASAFFNKVREVMISEGDGDTFQQFVDMLAGVVDEEGAATFCSKVCSVLENYPALAAESLLLFQPGQALEQAQFMNFLQITSMADFITKLEAFFSRQPQIIRLIVSSLASLAEKPGVTETEVKTVMLPLLKSSPLLTDLFLSLLPNSQPPESLMGDFEDLVCEENEPQDDEEPVETLHVPLEESGENCTCRTDCEGACGACGLKFIHGKIFLQSGKTLRPAKISFLNEDINAAARRLSIYSSCERNSANRIRKRASNSFSSDPVRDSPPKSNNEESDTELDTELKVNGKASKIKRMRKDSQLLSPTDEHSDEHLEVNGAFSPGNDDFLEEFFGLDEELEEEEDEFEDLDDMVDDSSQEKNMHGSPELLRHDSNQDRLVHGSPEILRQDSSQERLAQDSPELRQDSSQDGIVQGNCELLMQDSSQDHLDQYNSEAHNSNSGHYINGSSEISKVNAKRLASPDRHRSSDTASDETSPLAVTITLPNDFPAPSPQSILISQPHASIQILAKEEPVLQVVQPAAIFSVNLQPQENILTGLHSEPQADAIIVQTVQAKAPSQPQISVQSAKAASQPQISVQTVKTPSQPQISVQAVKAPSQSQISVQAAKSASQSQISVQAAKAPSQPQISVQATKSKPEISVQTTKASQINMQGGQSSSPKSKESSKVRLGDGAKKSRAEKTKAPAAKAHSAESQDPCWTREEDKSILQAFQQGGTAQRMLLQVKQLLPDRTPEQIMSRFQILLKLLQQMSSAAREGSSRN